MALRKSDVVNLNVPLKMAILKTGRKQYRIAADAGIAEAVLSRIVNGLHHPTDEQKRALAKALRLPVDDLFPSVAA